MFIIYDLVFVVFAVAYLPYFLIRRKWHRGFWARLGLGAPPTVPPSPGEDSEGGTGRGPHPAIWVHAVSVGEILSIKRFVEQLKMRFSKHNIVISTVTQAGYRAAQTIFQNGEKIIYAPLDFSFSVNRFINAIDPKMYITAETEIWPNLFEALHKHHIPIVQINGRLSQRAFRGYHKLRPLVKRILACVNYFCMQTKADAQRLIALGAFSERVRVVGNIKFDDLPDLSNFDAAALGFKNNESLWIAGSTHEGEEQIILNIFKDLLPEFPFLRLVIAPRHVERSDEIVQLAAKCGFTAVKFSRIAPIHVDQRLVTVLDTIGHLKSLYSLAKIVFVGKSLTVGGGHNIIEPAYFAKPVIIGPHMKNFQDITDIFMQEKSVIQVRDAQELLGAVKRMLLNPAQAQALGMAAKNVIGKHTGATAQTVAIVSEYLSAIAPLT